MSKLRFRVLQAAFGALALVSIPASAAVTLTSTPGAGSYSGPTPTYDFETPAPFTGGLVTNASTSGIRARPLGSTGNYATVGPSDGTPGILNLATFGDIDWISFIWGSIDTYNTLDVLDATGATIASFGGANVIAMANGNRTDPATNRIVKLTFTGADRSNVSGLRFRSTGNAFEFDNVAIAAAVPEPATWMMMLLGMAGVGFSMRRKSKPAMRVRFA